MSHFKIMAVSMLSTYYYKPSHLPCFWQECSSAGVDGASCKFTICCFTYVTSGSNCWHVLSMHCHQTSNSAACFEHCWPQKHNLYHGLSRLDCSIVIIRLVYAILDIINVTSQGASHKRELRNIMCLWFFGIYLWSHTRRTAHRWQVKPGLKICLFADAAGLL